MKDEEKRIERNRKARESYKKTKGKYWVSWYQKNKEHHDGVTNEYRNTKKGKEYVIEYNSRPEVKARVKEWRNKHPHYSRDWARKKMLMEIGE